MSEADIYNQGKKKLRYCAAILLLSCLPMSSLAAEWVLILASDDIEVEIDKQSVRPNKGAWFKFVMTPPTKKGCEYSEKKVASTKDYVEANCKEFSIRTKQSIVYSEDGGVINSCGFNNPKAVFSEYAPETIGESLFKAICDPKSRQPNLDAFYKRMSKLKLPLYSNCLFDLQCAEGLVCKATLGSSSKMCLVPD